MKTILICVYIFVFAHINVYPTDECMYIYVCVYTFVGNMYIYVCVYIHVGIPKQHASQGVIDERILILLLQVYMMYICISYRSMYTYLYVCIYIRTCKPHKHASQGALDENNHLVLTQSMVHRTHQVREVGGSGVGEYMCVCVCV